MFHEYVYILKFSWLVSHEPPQVLVIQSRHLKHNREIPHSDFKTKSLAQSKEVEYGFYQLTHSDNVINNIQNLESFEIHSNNFFLVSYAIASIITTLII